MAQNNFAARISQPMGKGDASGGKCVRAHGARV
jgi:hypothetical protein